MKTVIAALFLVLAPMLCPDTLHAGGNLIVDGNLGVGTSTYTGKLNVTAPNYTTGISLLSGASGSYTGYSLGRTGPEGYLGVAAAAGHFGNGSLTGDIVLHADYGLLLTAAGGTSPIYLKNNGYFGIGTANPAGKLHLAQNAGWGGGFLLEDYYNHYRAEIMEGYDANLYFRTGSQTTYYGYMNYYGYWGTASDADLKENIADMSKYGLETVLNMKPREYDLRKDQETQRLFGFVAQEMKAVVPEVVGGTAKSAGGYGLGIAYGQLTPILVKAIQEQQRQIADQKSTLKEFSGAIHVDKTGSVGIGTSYPNATLDVNGTFAATTKYFDIKDPRFGDAGKRLIHSSLEGPEVGVYYRGEARLEKGAATVTLPPYFEALTRKENRTVLLTPKFENEKETLCSVAASEVKDAKFMIRAFGNNASTCAHKVYWEVKGERKDVEKLTPEQTR